MIPTCRWLEPLPWEAVVELNRALCESAKNFHQLKIGASSPVRALWEGARSEEQSLRLAIEVCSQCRRLAPFEAYNGATFSAIARILGRDVLKPVNPIKAYIFSSAAGHYVAGVMDHAEFQQVYRRIEQLLEETSKV